MIDTHSHLDGEEFKEDINDVILRAKEAGVTKILVPAISLELMPNLLQVCEKNKDYLIPMIGLHPEEVKSDYQEKLNKLYKILKDGQETPSNAKFIAIGEIGLDFYWDDTFKKEQLDAFEQQVQWAIEYNLPLMIHTRKAYNEMISIMERHRKDNLSGVFHCFSASKEIAEKLLTFDNFMLGIGGIVTFKNSTLPNVIKEAIPLERIVLETDSPYMSPTPFRGKRNESSYLKEIVAKLADIFECKIDEISKQTDKNCSIFKLK